MSISRLSPSSVCKTASLSETLSGGKVIHAAALKADRAGALREDYAAEGLLNVEKCRLVEVHLVSLVGSDSPDVARSLCGVYVCQ